MYFGEIHKFHKISKYVILILIIGLFCPINIYYDILSFITNLNEDFYRNMPIRIILNTAIRERNRIFNMIRFDNITGDIQIIPKYPATNTGFYREFQTSVNKFKEISNTKASKNEALKVFHKALELKKKNNTVKARRLFIHALKLDSKNPDILAEFGELIEKHDTNIILAEYYCTKAVLSSPMHFKGKACRKRTSPIVEELDQKKLNTIDAKIYQFYQLPENHPKLKEIKKDQYFSYIFHTAAIEGNTMNLYQTRILLETRLAIGGKSIVEQNEILGLDSALKFINSLLNKGKNEISLRMILEIHRRVLGFVDISEAGQFRNRQVYIGDHIPPHHTNVPVLMAEFADWLQDQEYQNIHPIELAALAHWKFVYIHPFQDGNGRTARLLMNFILMKANYPPSIIKNEHRELYFKLIKLANEGDVRPFIRFIADCTEKTIDDYLSAKIPEKIETHSADIISFLNEDRNLTLFYSEYQ